MHKIWKLPKTILSRKPHRLSLPFEATQTPSCYVVLLHLIPIAAVVVITSLNLYGYWIGKELSGIKNKNSPKELALQLTAKLHELLMLASLNEALLTHLLKCLAFGHGLPFASLTAGTKFKDLSYLWSRDFWAMCATSYHRKSQLIPLMIVCVLLGVVIGPSSAVVLIPRLDVWPAGEAVMKLNTSDNLLWPAKLEQSASDVTNCNRSTLGCFNPSTWDSIGANLFSYWGHITTGGSTSYPQHINVPSISSLRSMDIRLRDSVGPSIPPYTMASVQHAVIGDMVNSFRFLTLPSRSAKCKRSWSPAICSYKDLSWFVHAMQPVAVTTCLETQIKTSSVEFPIINHASSLLKTTSVSLNASFDNETQAQFRWTTLDSNPQLLDASIAVLVRLKTAAGAGDYACTIQAQWANATTSTSFISTNYLVESAVPGFEYYALNDDEYRGRTVVIEPQWAQQSVEKLVVSQTNTTVFENFWNLGQTSDDLSIKLEAILSVLFVEKMAHTGSGTVPLSITSKDLCLKIQGELVPPSQTAAATSAEVNQRDFALKTAMTGYGYGLYTTSGLSASVLVSMVVLYVYSAVTLGHLVSLYVGEDPYIVSWREEREMLLMCLWSRFRPAAWEMGSQEGAGKTKTGQGQGENLDILRDIVVVTSRKRRAALSLLRRDWPDEV